jgi:hypothetical protein
MVKLAFIAFALSETFVAFFILLFLIHCSPLIRKSNEKSYYNMVKLAFTAFVLTGTLVASFVFFFKSIN